MNELKRHDLDFNKTLPYVENNIKDLSTLANELLKALDFNSGSFFTLLPEDADLKQLYKFTEGGILPENPRIEYDVNGGKGSYSFTPTLNEEIAHFILNEITGNKSLIGIFEDYCASPGDPYRNFNEIHRLTHRYNEEMYYIVNSETTKDQIKRCIRQSHAIWHSLCVLTKVDSMDENNEELTLEELQSAGRNAQMIIVGAYDAEGYIFWERSK